MADAGGQNGEETRQSVSSGPRHELDDRSPRVKRRRTGFAALLSKLGIASSHSNSPQVFTFSHGACTASRLRIESGRASSEGLKPQSIKEAADNNTPELVFDEAQARSRRFLEQLKKSASSPVKDHKKVDEAHKGNQKMMDIQSLSSLVRVGHDIRTCGRITQQRSEVVQLARTSDRNTSKADGLLSDGKRSHPCSDSSDGTRQIYGHVNGYPQRGRKKEFHMKAYGFSRGVGRAAKSGDSDETIDYVHEGTIRDEVKAVERPEQNSVPGLAEDAPAPPGHTLNIMPGEEQTRARLKELKAPTNAPHPREGNANALKLDSEESITPIKQKTCRRCGQKGHNSRTCTFTQLSAGTACGHDFAKDIWTPIHQPRPHKGRRNVVAGNPKSFAVGYSSKEVASADQGAAQSANSENETIAAIGHKLEDDSENETIAAIGKKLEDDSENETVADIGLKLERKPQEITHNPLADSISAEPPSADVMLPSVPVATLAELELIATELIDLFAQQTFKEHREFVGVTGSSSSRRMCSLLRGVYTKIPSCAAGKPTYQKLRKNALHAENFELLPVYILWHSKLACWIICDKLKQTGYIYARSLHGLHGEWSVRNERDIAVSFEQDLGLQVVPLAVTP